MGAFYGLRIRSGIMKLDDVPAFWRGKVDKWLADNPAE